MSPKRSAFALSAILAATALLGIAPASAGDGFGVEISIDVHDGHHGHARHHRHHGHRPLTGPQLYYGYHYDHIPAYPVPIFKSYHPPLVVRPVARYRVSSSPHVAWCHARYRSYRAHDNSFQPYQGGRRQCWSPYG